MKNRFGIDWSRHAGAPFWRRPHVSRRAFFRHLGAGVGGYFLMPARPMETVAQADSTLPATARNCILIMMAGGPAHTDTFDLKEGAWLPASFNPTTYNGVRFPQGLMPTLAQQMDSLVMLRSLRAWVTVHDIARNWVLIGRNPLSGLSKIAPHIGSVAAMELGSKSAIMPAFISLNAGDGPGAGYFPPDDAPFYITPGGAGLANTTHKDGQTVFNRRYPLLLDLDQETRTQSDLTSGIDSMAQFNSVARQLMYNSSVDKIFTFDAAERTRYGSSGFGNACITARNLLAANMGTRFIQITVGGWDNHSSIYTTALNPANAGSAARQFDLGLGTLMTDLKTAGLFDDTLIVTLGEFGRTVGAPNATNGRDHAMQQAALITGGRVSGGRAIGATDATGRTVADPGWSRAREIRNEDLEATIYRALGIDWKKVRRDDPLNRGFEYVPSASTQDLYGPINELWG